MAVYIPGIYQENRYRPLISLIYPPMVAMRPRAGLRYASKEPFLSVSSAGVNLIGNGSWLLSDQKPRKHIYIETQRKGKIVKKDEYFIQRKIYRKRVVLLSQKSRANMITG